MVFFLLGMKIKVSGNGELVFVLEKWIRTNLSIIHTLISIFLILILWFQACVGPVIAERIVAWRMANGPFRSVAELGEVSGIGPAMIARIEDQVGM